MKGKLIVFEGIDGSGKTSLSSLLVRKLIREGYSSIWDKEPTDRLRKDYPAIFSSSTVENSKQIFGAQSSYFHRNELNFFLLDRFTHEQKLKSDLEENDFLILDRYILSTMAYQGNCECLEKQFSFIAKLNQGFLHPHLCFFLKINPNMALKRIMTNRSKSYFEHDLSRIAKNYDQAIDTFIQYFPNTKLIPLEASKSSKVLLKEVYQIIKDLFLT